MDLMEKMSRVWGKAGDGKTFSSGPSIISSNSNSSSSSGSSKTSNNNNSSISSTTTAATATAAATITTTTSIPTGGGVGGLDISELKKRCSGALSQFEKGNILLTDLEEDLRELKLKFVPVVRLLCEKLAKLEDITWILEVACMLFEKGIINEQDFLIGGKEYVDVDKEEIEGCGVFYTSPYEAAKEEAPKLPEVLGSLFGKLHTAGRLKLNFIDEFATYAKSIEDSTEEQLNYDVSTIRDKFQNPLNPPAPLKKP